MKVRKVFNYEGVELKIVERIEPYLNATVKMTRVISVNGGVIPIQIKHRQTLKSIIQETINTLNNFKENGCNVVTELTRRI